MIMEKYGSPDGIMSALYTNIKVGDSSLYEYLLFINEMMDKNIIKMTCD